MSQRPTDAEAEARLAQSNAVYEAVQVELNANAARAGKLDPPLFFVTFSQRYRTKEHPVLGKIDIDAVIGLKAHNSDQARAWAQHWLGMRGFSDVLSQQLFDEAQADERGPAFPGGCPRVEIVPPARHYVHVQGKRIIVWEVPDWQGTDEPSLELDCYAADGKKAQTSATAQALREGYGAWRETFFSYDGEELTLPQITEICERAGVL